jgi:ApaG protein
MPKWAAMPNPTLEVTVEPRFLPEQSDPEQALFCFAYTITLTNHSEVGVQLISRHWKIHDARGHTEEVKGLGVVGQQPLLKPGESFQYTSGCQLRSASGTMHGSYFFVTEEGDPFEVAIPLFVLEASGGHQPMGRVLH